MLNSAATQAELKLTGSGSLKDYLADLNKNNAQFLKDSKAQKKTFEELNKVGSKTEDMFKSLAENSKTFFDRTVKFTRTGKDTLRFFKDTGSATITLQENLEKSSKGVKGLALDFLGLRGKARGLSKGLEGPAKHLVDIADASSNTERAFVILDKVSKPLVTGLSKLSDITKSFGQTLRDSEKFVASFARTITNVGAKSLQFFSQTFASVADNLKSSGMFGRIFASNFEAISGALDTASKSAEDFALTINPEDFDAINKATESLGKGFERVSTTIGKVARGVYLADFLGDIFRTKIAAKDMATAIKDDAAMAVQEFSKAAGPAAVILSSIFTKFQIISTAASALGFILKNDLLTGIGAVTSKFMNISIVVPAMQQLVLATGDAVVKASGLADNFTVMQNLGIDTSAAAIAFQFGLVGEKLLLSGAAAKQFGMIASQAFLQLEDASAFVTTIGAGANIQLEGVSAGIESVSASLQNLVNKDLKNVVTSTEAAGALYNALSAGIGIANDNTLQLGETNKFLEASLKLSSASGADAAQTLELLAKTTNVYSLSNTQAATTAAKLYQIVEEGIVQFPELTNQLGDTFAVGKSLNISLEEVGGSIAALTKITRGDTALVGYRSLLQSIAGQGAQAQKAISELGIQFDVNSVKTKGLIASLKDLYAATGGNVGVLKEIIPDSLAFRTALNLMTTAADDAESTMARMGETGEEALDNLFERRQQSTIRQYTALMNGFNEVLIDLGSRTLPALAPGIDFLENLLGMLKSMPDWMKDSIGVLILFQTGLVNLGGAAMGMVASIAQLIAMFVAFNLFQKVLSGQLPKLVNAIKDLNSAGFDLGGTLALLVGYNKNLQPGVAAATAELKQQARAMDLLNKQGLNFTGDIKTLEGLKEALELTRRKFKDLQDAKVSDRDRSLIDFEGDLSDIKNVELALSQVEQKLEDIARSKGPEDKFFDSATEDLIRFREKLFDLANNPINFDKQEAELRGLEKVLENLVGRKSAERTDVFGGWKKKIAEGMNGIALTVKEKKRELGYVLNDYFDTFGESSQGLKAEFSQKFNEILSDAQLTVEQKSGQIGVAFEEMLAKSPNEIREDLAKMKDFLVQGVQDIYTETTPRLLKLEAEWKVKLSNLVGQEVVSSIGQRFDVLKGVVTKGFDSITGAGSAVGQEMAHVFKTILSDSEMTVQEKVNAINERFSELIKSAPEDVQSDLERVKNITISGISDIKESIDRGTTIAGDSISRIAGDQVQSMVRGDLVKLGQVVSAGFDSIPLTALEAFDNLEQFVQASLLDTSLTVQQKTEQINTFFSRLGEGVDEEVKSNLDRIKASVDAKLHTIVQPFSSIADSEIQAKVDANFLKFSETVSSGTDRVIKGVGNVSGIVNEKLEDIANQPVATQIDGNLKRVDDVVKKGVNQVAQTVESGGRRVEQGFNKMGKASRSAGNLLSNFFPQVGFAQVILQDTGDLLDNLGLKIGGVTKATKSADTAQKASVATSKALVVVETQKVAATGAATAAITAQGTSAGFAAAANTFLAKASASASLGLAKLGSFGVVTAASMKLVAAAAFSAAGMVSGLAAAVWALMAPLLPIIAAIGAVVAVFALLTKVLASVVPGLDRLISANARAAQSARDFREELKESNEELARFTQAAKEDVEIKLNAKSARREVQDLREELAETLDEMVVPKKAMLQGFRGVLSDINMMISKLDPVKLFRGALARGTTVGLNLVNRLVPEGPLKKRIDNAVFSIRKMLKQVEIDEQEAFNKRREKAQAGISSRLMKEIDQIKRINKSAGDMMDSALEAYERGNAATIRGNKMLQNAVAEGRALTSDEYLKFREIEEEYFEDMKKKNASRLEGLTALQEKAKDPAVIAALQEEIDKFADLGSEIEQAAQKAVVYRENIQQLLRAAGANQAADGVDQLNNSLSNLYNTLSEEAQAIFSEQMGELTVNVSTERLIDDFDSALDAFESAGQKYNSNVNKVSEELEADVTEAVEGPFKGMGDGLVKGTKGFEIETEKTVTKVEADFEKLGLGFKSAAERMRSNAAIATRATMSQLIADITNPEKQITSDDLTTGLNNSLQAIGDAYIDEGQKLEAIIQTVNQKVVIEGREFLLRELLKPQDYESIAETVVEATNAVAERQVAVNAQSLEKLKALREQGLVSTKQVLAQELAIQEQSDRAVLKAKEDGLRALEESNMGDSRVAQDLEAEVTRLRIENDNKVFANKVKLAEAENDLAMEQNQRELKMVQAQIGARILTEQEGIRETSRLEEEAAQSTIDEKKKVVQAFIAAGRSQTEEGKKAAAELMALELEFDALRLNNRKNLLESELNLLRAQKDNEFKVIEQSFQKELNLFTLREKAMKMESDAMSANKELASAIQTVEEATVQAKLKFTGDIVERAKIEQQMAVNKQKALVEEQKFEMANLEMQQTLNSMALEREAIGLRLNKLELDKNLILTQQRLNRAAELKLTEEETTSLELQVSGLQQQIELNAEQQSQLASQAETQDEINAKQRTTLKLRQEATRIQSASEIELANQQIIMAGYEQQKQQLQNNAKVQELAGNTRLEQLKKEEDLLNQQTAILQKQYDQIKQTSELSQRMYALAQQTATSGFQQARIQKEAAIERRNNLAKVQEIERVNLQINQMLEILALKRKEIELDVAEVKQKAAFAQAVADEAKVKADKTASQEERDAAALNTQAQAQVLGSFSQQRQSAQAERELLGMSQQMARSNQERGFRADRLDADAAVAQTTRRRGDDRRVSREALSSAREFDEDTQNFMQNFMQGFSNLQRQVGQSANPTQIANTLGQPVNQAMNSIVGTGASTGTGILNGLNQAMPNQQTGINGTVNVILEVKGEGASKLNSEELQKAASDALYKGLDKLFDYSLNRRQI